MSGASRPRTSLVIRVCFGLVVGSWLTLPFLWRGVIAQDAPPYIAAGQLVTSEPDQIYAAGDEGVADVSPTFRDAYCEAGAVDAADCDRFAVAFVATPAALPFAYVAGHLSASQVALALRMIAALSLVAGMVLLWGRLAVRTPLAPSLLTLTAMLITPMAVVPIKFAQTSPLLFLSVCLGMGTTATRRGRTVLAGFVYAWSVAFKAFPALLIAVAIWSKRRGFLVAAGVTLGVLGALTLVLAPASIVGDFLRSAGRVGNLSPNQSSVYYLVLRAIGESPTTEVVATAVCMVLAVAMVRVGMRGVDDHTRWAIGSVAVLVLSPVVWAHYLWVPFGAIAIALAGQRRLDDRLVALLPLFAVVSLPPNDLFSTTPGRMPVYQGLMLLVSAGVVTWLGARIRRQSIAAARGAAA